jgi:hypothetical protein
LTFITIDDVVVIKHVHGTNSANAKTLEIMILIRYMT